MVDAVGEDVIVWTTKLIGSCVAWRGANASPSGRGANATPLWGGADATPMARGANASPFFVSQA